MTLRRSHQLIAEYTYSVNAQVINGPDIVSTRDQHAYLANRPDIGDIYTIRLCYDELCNDYEDFEYTITGINDNFAWIDYPADNETINITTPTFTWQAPPGTVDHYRINIHDVTGEKDEFIWGENIPAGQTHFEVPESANLQWGNVYKIYLHSYDENGNQATTVSNFEVLVD